MEIISPYKSLFLNYPAT